MNANTILAVALLLLPSPAAAVAAGDGSARTPYDVVRESYRPYMPADDPLAFPLKVRSVTKDPYTFWRGAKPLFYRWCLEHAGDWRGDKQAYVTSHGDLHLGNIGSYAAEGKLGALAFGEVDFDDSARLPFQVELLHGLITLHLIARQQSIDLSAEHSVTLRKTMLDAYAVGLTSGRRAGDATDDDRRVKELLNDQGEPYGGVLKELCEGDRFKRLVYGGKGTPKELLRPVEQQTRDAIADAIARAAAAQPGLHVLLRSADADTLRASVKDVALRTRMESSGSQGLRKYLVLLERPLVGIDHDAILYLKQQIPAAAERAEFVARDPRPPGERCAADAALLARPGPWINAWCEVKGVTYWLGLKESWSDELDFEDVTKLDELLAAARTWGTVAGEAHASAAAASSLTLANDLAARINNALGDVLQQRCDEYLTWHEATYQTFTADPRVTKDSADARRAVEQFVGEHSR